VATRVRIPLGLREKYLISGGFDAELRSHMGELSIRLSITESSISRKIDALAPTVAKWWP
jgi:hypothetical protein